MKKLRILFLIFLLKRHDLVGNGSVLIGLERGLRFVFSLPSDVNHIVFKLYTCFHPFGNGLEM